MIEYKTIERYILNCVSNFLSISWYDELFSIGYYFGSLIMLMNNEFFQANYLSSNKQFVFTINIWTDNFDRK